MEEKTLLTFGGGFDPLPHGTYRARIERVVPVPSSYGDSLRWEFALEDHPDREPTWGFTSAKLSTRSKAGDWLRNIGFNLSYGEQLDLADLAGIEVALTLSVRTNDEGAPSNRVEDVRLWRAADASPPGHPSSAPPAARAAPAPAPAAPTPANGGAAVDINAALEAAASQDENDLGVLAEANSPRP